MAELRLPWPWPWAYLVEVDDGLPKLVLQLVEVPHTDFTEVTRVVLVHVRAVVVLTTGKTTTTGVLAVLAYTTMTGRDVATAVMERQVSTASVERDDAQVGCVGYGRTACASGSCG